MFEDILSSFSRCSGVHLPIPSTCHNQPPTLLPPKKNKTTPLPVPFQQKKTCVSVTCHLSSMVCSLHVSYICFRLKKQRTKLTCDRCSKRWRLIKASSTVCKASRPGGNSSAGTPCSVTGVPFNRGWLVVPSPERNVK